MARWSDDPLFDRLRRLTEAVQDLSPMRPYHGLDDRDTWCPSVDTYETEAGLALVFELPGVSPDKIDLKVEGRTLTLSGTRPEPEGSRKVRLHRMEIDYGPFERRIRLPEGVDPDGVQAQFRDGFLHILIPRLPGSRDQIPIREG